MHRDRAGYHPGSQVTENRRDRGFGGALLGLRRAPRQLGGEPSELRPERVGQTGSFARWRCMAALRERLTRPWRSISVTTTMTSSPTDTTSSTVGTW